MDAGFLDAVASRLAGTGLTLAERLVVMDKVASGSIKTSGWMLANDAELTDCLRSSIQQTKGL
jgi:hypothetical protein